MSAGFGCRLSTAAILAVALISAALAEPVDVKAFNRGTVEAHAKGESWCRSPLMVALKLVGDRHESKTRTIEIESSPESFHDAQIVLTEEGLLDDSIAGIRYTLELRKSPKGYWVVQSADKTWKCYPGRGHEEYSDKPCL